jgi:ribosomal-protein-alanine N-acetyltransferase
MIEKTAVLTDHQLHIDPAEGESRVGDWRFTLPVLSMGEVVLREVRVSDAHSLVSLLTTPEITRFISTPPDTVEGFERFIVASQKMRAAGQGACFAVTLRGYDTAIGIFQVRKVNASVDDAMQLGGSIDTAEWGFAIGSPFWGAGIFQQCASLIMQFAFDYVGVHRLEARCAVKNGRGNKALLKMGAVPEGILRKTFLCGDEYLDQVLYAIVEHEWRSRGDRARSARPALVH